MSPTAKRISEAEAHASRVAFPTNLVVWRYGIAVEMWDRGRRIERRVTWAEIDYDFVNPIIAAIDRCVGELVKQDA